MKALCESTAALWSFMCNQWKFCGPQIRAQSIRPGLPHPHAGPSVSWGHQGGGTLMFTQRFHLEQVKYTDEESFPFVYNFERVTAQILSIIMSSIRNE